MTLFGWGIELIILPPWAGVLRTDHGRILGVLDPSGRDITGLIRPPWPSWMGMPMGSGIGVVEARVWPSQVVSERGFGSIYKIPKLC